MLLRPTENSFSHSSPLPLRNFCNNSFFGVVLVPLWWVGQKVIVSSWYRVEVLSGIIINDSAHHYIWHKYGGYSMEMTIRRRRRVMMMMIVIIVLIMMMMVTMTMTNILVIWETQGGHHTIWNGPRVRTPEAQWPFWASEFSTACEVVLIMMKMMQNTFLKSD